MGQEEPFPVPRPSRRGGSNFPAPGREWEGPESAQSTDHPPGFAAELPGGPFQGLVPALSALTVPSSRTRAGAIGAHLLGTQSDREWARAVLRDIARRYLASRRECVDPFVDRHFSLTGTLRLHRRAIGWDLFRVPVNLLLSPVMLVVSVASRIAARLGLARTAAWLDWHRPFFDTAVAREVSWLVTTELLQLPCAQPWRMNTGDALADAILSDPCVAGRICVDDVLPAEDRARIATAISGYAGTRAATAEIATGSIAAGIGAVWVKHATPGMVTLGSVVANVVAYQTAIAAFPLGAGLGAWWYGMYPVAPSAELLAITTGAFAVVGALFAVFSGIVTDPFQRVIGLHRRRLLRLMGALEDVLCGDGEGRFPLRDHLCRSADRSTRPFSRLAYRARLIRCGPQPP